MNAQEADSPASGSSIVSPGCRARGTIGGASTAPKRSAPSPPRASPRPRPTRGAAGQPSSGQPRTPRAPTTLGPVGAVAPPADSPNRAQTLSSEVDLATERTRTEFDACYAGAGGARMVHGSVTVAFRVVADGRVANAAAVENTTASREVAACLVAAIGRWTFVARPSVPASFSRTFTYR